MSFLMALFVTVLLLIGSGFFVAAERHRMEKAAAEGRRGAGAALAGMRELSLMLAGAQLGITVCTLGLGSLSKPAISHELDPLLHDLGLPSALSYGVAFAVAMIVVVFLRLPMLPAERHAGDEARGVGGANDQDVCLAADPGGGLRPDVCQSVLGIGAGQGVQGAGDADVAPVQGALGVRVRVRGRDGRAPRLDAAAAVRPRPGIRVKPTVRDLEFPQQNIEFVRPVYGHGGEHDASGRVGIRLSIVMGARHGYAGGLGYERKTVGEQPPGLASDDQGAGVPDLRPFHRRLRAGGAQCPDVESSVVGDQRAAVREVENLL